MLLGLAVLAAVGYGGERVASTGPAAHSCLHGGCLASVGSDASAGSPQPLYALIPAYASPSALTRVDPKTLDPVGEQLSIPLGMNAGALSPDGHELVLVGAETGAILIGTSQTGLPPTQTKPGRRVAPPSLSIVDLPAMRFETRVQRALDSALSGWQVVATAWPSQGRLLVVAQRLGGRIAFGRVVLTRTTWLPRASSRSPRPAAGSSGAEA